MNDIYYDISQNLLSVLRMIYSDAISVSNRSNVMQLTVCDRTLVFFQLTVSHSLLNFTVLFSFEKGLVSAETPSEMARRVFKSFDPDGNNFIQSENLQEVLKRLQLVSEPPE